MSTEDRDNTTGTVDVEDKKMSRGRLAPSPTGAQHLGNARTHLAAFWAARQAGAELALRIDDLDSPRVKSWAQDQAIEDLCWLGIDWDTTIAKQTNHLAQYRDAVERLRLQGLIYPCYCSRKDIEEAISAPHESRFRGELAPYPGICSGYRVGDIIQEREHCFRFRVSSETLEFDDLLMGNQRCNPAEELGDFPVVSRNGQASYQLAVLIDDQIQGVDQVVRGNDLVASTFRQIDLAGHLGLDSPSYAHVPLVRGLDGRRLAKRHGDTRLSFYRDCGIRPEMIVGWAAFSLGLIDRLEECQANEVIEQFAWSKLPEEDILIDPQTVFSH
ncbi:tRNA glutamyl-Q(34) synthetase GluQRS [Stieleria sp. JC731]|uniref:tRNA glutamyl-Q(34) synthetase GluQRS n=1 Tax=Pirellulaceae TaxID=2691357 RepID=UPI001E59465E|nr:tRNA glutamyl-Q(34) synthetase GluQRS [Stieleria sp. JC731]MCC9601550.1 tRNA glutamyl-Q(34) synthetase GluQRS [Stieleria sp. JC731]